MNSTKIGKYTITYNNLKEFHILKSEIFGNNCYDIELDTDRPYIINVGAYIGISTIYFKNMYPNSKILAFEPNPYAREILEKNIFINDLKDITVLPFAIDSSERKRNLFIDTSENIWQSTASFFRDSWNGKYHNDTSVEVETRKLSTYLKDTTVDLLKLDIEGLETKVLKEARGELKNVKNILVEYHPIEKENLKKLLNLLTSSNFKISFHKHGKEMKNPSKNNLFLIKAQKTL